VTTDESSVAPSVTGSPNGDRILVGSASSCNAAVDGGGGDDEIHVNAGTRDDLGELGCSTENPVTGGDGDDLIDAHNSKIDLIYESSAGHDVFTGGSGNDHITVGDGPDWAFGGAGNDRFYDNGGADPSKLWGGPGNDVYTDWDTSEADITFFDGGSGSDTVAYHNTGGTTGVNLSLDGLPNDGISGEFDNIKTSVEVVGDAVYNTTGQYTGNDVISGSSGPNNLGGYNGNDTLDGLGGQDTLRGGSGNDAITGGAGPDTILGENNNDEIFAEDGEVDTITCGSGTDIAHADPGDNVNADCESVL
jgi:Ca2+-binding RTX toxin-like protein